MYMPLGSSPLSLAKVKGRTLISMGSACIWSDSREINPGEHVACMFGGWSESTFFRFAFDLISVMNGTYRPDRVSSLHGLTFSREANSG